MLYFFVNPLCQRRSLVDEHDSKIENAMHKNGDRLVGDDNGEDQLPPINIHNNMPTNEKFVC